MKKLFVLLLFIPFFNFSQVQIGMDIDGDEAGDRFGQTVSLSLDGNIMAIGSSFSSVNGENSGQVKVYENQLGVWIQIGSDINGEVSGDRFGRSVSLSADGSIVAFGALFDDENGFATGQFNVYENQSDIWTQIGTSINGDDGNDRLGSSISLSSDGSIVAIGAEGHGFGGAGLVRMYKNQTGIWTQIGNDINGEASGDRLGNSVSLSSDGNIVAVGSDFNDGNGPNSGQVRVYENLLGTWTQIGNDLNGEAWSQFGW